MENVATKKPDDYVIATGKQYSVKQFIEESFKYFGIKILWQGEGIQMRLA